VDSTVLFYGSHTREGKKMKLVSINIVNWNGLYFLKNCIKSIKEQTYSNIEINIIDNNSSDTSIGFLNENFPEINLVVNTENKGFSKAHNQAIEISEGDYIIPLNFDITLTPTFVEEMVRAIESSPEIGIVSGKLYIMNDIGQTTTLDTTGITMSGMYPADRGQYEVDKGQYSNRELVFGASGAAPMLSRKMLEDIKINNEYFDEDFFIYVEDVDLCWRSQLYGWKALYTPSAVAYHFRGATRNSDSKMKKDYLLLGHRNRYLAVVKNAILLDLLKNIMWILFYEIGFYLNQFRSGNYFIFLVPFMVTGKIRKMLAKRVIIQGKNKVAANYMEPFFFSNMPQIIKNKFQRQFSKRSIK
jgi:GT2 family glycosyltransferase